MKDVTGLFVVFAALMGRVGGMEPSNGYCIGNQCFTLFQHPSDFTTAQDRCKEQSGHLMTVRSSVSQDILLILLGNFPGKYWIGLHRPTGCPDTDTKLKGYEWVTEDGESDFYNWETFNYSCSSPRCITVSQENAFKWIQKPCSEQAVGFLCEYTFHGPCKGLSVTATESVSYRIPMGYEGGDLLSLPPGSIATRMPFETRYVCFSEQWLKAPWSCEIQEGGCEHKCAVDPKHVAFCYCPQGQIINPENKVTCEVVADDPCLRLNCQHACHKNGDSYTCMCDHGFKLGSDNRSCVDFNDCKDERQCPGKNFMCVNTVGGFQCVCKTGYKMKGGQCHDVDECVSAPCEHMCDNFPGGYKCSCYDGYKADPESPHRCKLYCGLEECPAECDPNNQYQCFCPDGYVIEERGALMICIDIDECDTYCDQDCTNLFGGYTCSCSAGFTLVDQYKCVKNDIDDTDEGSGTTTTPNALTPTPLVPNPDPTPGPSGVTVGVFVGIIVCTVFFTVLLVFLAHHFLCGRGKMESAGALKAPEGEAHGLHRVTSDMS
ncbi:hypothetical protein PAMP_014495 [Pampus punctatissimus]